MCADSKSVVIIVYRFDISKTVLQTTHLTDLRDLDIVVGNVIPKVYLCFFRKWCLILFHHDGIFCTI